MKDKHLVAITDFTFPDLAMERGILEPLGCDVIGGQCRTEEGLINLTVEADHVITQFAPIKIAGAHGGYGRALAVYWLGSR